MELGTCGLPDSRPRVQESCGSAGNAQHSGAVRSNSFDTSHGSGTIKVSFHSGEREGGKSTCRGLPIPTVRVKFSDRKFPDFREALKFVNHVGELAEGQGHHPDISLAWGKVEITTWTHKINGLTESDFILAAKIDQLYKP